MVILTWLVYSPFYKYYSCNNLIFQEFEQYCYMVDDARKLNVEESMAYKPWSTEQFSGVLAKHTSEVINDL